MAEREAGRELDADVAQRVFGYCVFRCSEETWAGPDDRLWPADADQRWPMYLDGHVLRTIPAYSSKIEDAWRVVERMDADGYDANLSRERGEVWIAEFFPRDDLNATHGANAETAPLAICRAGLAALRATEDG